MRRTIVHLLLMSICCCLCVNLVFAQTPPYTGHLSFNGASADLSQARNGKPSEPVSPVDWQNGNLGSQTSHYVEGYSIPYIVELDGLPTAAQLIAASGDNKVHLMMGYDVKHSGKHAIDYLTYVDRLEPHAMFLHPVEDVDPIYDPDPQPRELFPPGTPPTSTFAILPPTSVGSPVAGMPTNSFNALPAQERIIIMWGGTITGFSYGPQADLNAAQATQTFYISFIPTAEYAVIAIGGHIGSRQDWGYDADVPRSAGGISGSPYHMRVLDWNLNNLGNQDRSLSADAVVEPPEPCNATLALCEEENDMATFDLTDASAQILCEEDLAIIGWFEDEAFTIPIATPTAYAASNGDIVFARVQDTETLLTAAAQVTLTVYPGLSLSLDANNVTCYNAGNGSIVLTVNGGTAPFTYDWSNDADTKDISSLVPGTYSVTVTDANQCSATGEATISQPAQIAYTVEHTDISCNGADDGTITVTVTSGTGVTINLNGSPMTQNGNVWTAIDLGPGNYAITASAPGNEGATCAGPEQAVVIDEPAAIAYTVESTDATCGGEENGSITVTVTSGTGVQIFLDGNLMTQNGNVWTATDLAAGDYTITSSAPGNNDAVCPGPTTPITIEGVQNIALTVESTDVTCYGLDDGSITVTVTSGENVSVYLDAILMTQNGNVWTATGLGPGTYAVTSSAPGNEGASCPGPGEEVTIAEPDQILIDVDHTDITCYGESDGTITVTVTSGDNVTVYLNDIAMTFNGGVWTATDLGPGTYTVTSSAPGNEGATCPGPTEEILITQPPQITLGFRHTDITCSGENDGTITVTVTGGQNVTVYIDGNPMTQNGNIWTATGLGVGTYEITSSAPGNEGATCPGPSQSIEISAPDDITLDFYHTDISCNGDNDGSITVIVTSGDDVTVYLDGEPMTQNGNIWTATDLGPGSYVITSSGVGNGSSYCPGPGETIEITEPDPISIQVNSIDITCYGADDGSITVTVTSGTNVSVYLNGNLMTQNGNIWTATGLGAGNYTVTTSAPGNNDVTCPGPQENLSLSEPPQITLDIDSSDITCFEDNDGTITVTVTSGDDVSVFLNDVLMTQNGNVWSATNLGPGTYTITSSAPGNEGATCVGPGDEITIIEPEELVCEIPNPGYATPLCGGYQNNLLTATVDGGTEPYVYKWTVDNPTWAITGNDNEISVMFMAGTGPATFTLEVWDDHQCYTTCTYTLPGCEAEDFCTYTQGFYGTPGGKTCSVSGPGTSPQDLMLSVLPVGSSYTFGSGNRSFTLYGSDIANGNIFAMLPGGGTPSTLGVYAGGAKYSVLASWPSVPISKKKGTYGSIDNNLLSQTITLFFNLGQNNSPSLGSFQLEPIIVTAESSDCGESIAVPYQDQVATVPQNVINYLNANYAGGATVDNLFHLANRILGGDPALVGITAKGYKYLVVSAADLTAAVDAINRIFDECRIYVPNDLRDAAFRIDATTSLARSASTEVEVIAEHSTEIESRAYPVPFENQLTIEFTVPYSTKAVVDIYTIDGRKLSTVFEREVKAHEINSAEFSAPEKGAALYIYRIATPLSVKYGKVMKK